MTKRKYSLAQCCQAVRHMLGRADDDVREMLEQAIKDLQFLEEHRGWFILGRTIFKNPAFQAVKKEFPGIDDEEIVFKFLDMARETKERERV